MTIDIPTTQEIPVVLVLSARSQEQRKNIFLVIPQSWPKARDYQ